jgi:hypothetical protein
MIVDPIDTHTLRPLGAGLYAVLQCVDVEAITSPPRVTVDAVKAALLAELGSTFGCVYGLVDRRAACRLGWGAGCEVPGCRYSQV